VNDASRFRNDDGAYLAWSRANPLGGVANVYSDNAQIHRTNCPPHFGRTPQAQDLREVVLHEPEHPATGDPRRRQGAAEAVPVCELNLV
jgi:hypothetical protein